jgi:hypothetical protein
MGVPKSCHESVRCSGNLSWLESEGIGDQRDGVTCLLGD